MRLAAALALVAFASAPALCADVVITSTRTNEAPKGSAEPAAKPTTSVTWFGKDRMRTEDGNRVTIVRADLKKMYVLDLKAKTASTIDLPLDMKKYMPAEIAPMMEQIKVTVTPTTETKKIKEWNATKYTLTMTMPSFMGGQSTSQDMWVTKDVKIDHTVYRDLQGSMMSTAMGGTSIANEYKKIDGFAVLTERSQMIMGQPVKSREEVVSVETKDAPEGHYEVPAGFTEKPFDMLGDALTGGRGGPGGPPPAEKPKGGG